MAKKKRSEMQIKASILYNKYCGHFLTAAIALLGMTLLIYGFSLTLSDNSANSDLPGFLLGLSTAKNTSHASVFAIAGSALLGGAIAISGIVKQRQTARSKNTIDFEAALTDSEPYNSSISQIGIIVDRKERHPIEEWAGDNQASSIEAIAIKTVLNYWERASNGVRKDVYDNDFLYDIYGTHVLNLYDVFGKFIEVRQKKLPKAYANFLELCENWTVKRQAEEKKAARKEKNKPKVESQEETQENEKE